MIQFQCQCADCLFTDYMPLRFSLRRMKKAFSDWQYKLEGKGWNMLYMENHDHPRIVSRYGSEEFQAQSAKSIAASYLFQKGTPFVYQGQEIGMTSWRPQDASFYRDVQTVWKYHNGYGKLSPEKKLKKLWRSSRDAARTPVQWSSDKNAGFTTGSETWIQVNPNYTQINVRQQEQDPTSVLNFYKKAIALRKSLSCVRHGIYKEHRPLSNQHYLYSMEDTQQKILVVCSFAKKNTKLRPVKGFPIESAQLVLCSIENPEATTLTPYETRVYLWNK
jgi:oligo-1,6-glucosidase